MWCEGENKLFMWMMAHYEVLAKKKAANFDETDWTALTECLPRKTLEDTKFECRMLSKAQQNEQWDNEELRLLNDIIR